MVSPSEPAAGYSGTPLVRKLGVKAGHEVLLVGAPDRFTIDDLPDDVRLRRPERVGTGGGAVPATRRRGEVPAPLRSDVVVAFFAGRAALEAELPGLSTAIVANGSLWVAWPRRAGGHESDVTDNDVRAVALPLGLVDVKVAALDHDWSGLKLVWRKELRDSLESR